MPTPRQFGNYILQIPTRAPIDDAGVPLLHLKYSTSHALRMVDYFIDLGKQTRVYEKGFRRHRKGLASLAFLQIMAAFERFLKEIAAVCVDELAGLCTDNRLDDFMIRGRSAFPHFQEQSIGRALCESDLWHNIDEVNKRFRRLLRLPSDPQNSQKFNLFDCNLTRSLRAETKVIEFAFQLRHTLAHNLGLVTPSDGAKLQRLLGKHLQSPSQLDIDRKHVFYLQQFLVPLCEELNTEIAKRLGDVLTEFHQQVPDLVEAQTIGPRLASLFRVPCSISNQRFSP